MLKPAIIGACVLVVWTGCETAPRRLVKKSEPPPDWDLSTPSNSEPVIVSTDATATETNFFAPPTNTVRKPKTNPPPRFSQPHLTWLSLDRWAVEHGLEKTHVVSASPVTSFELTTSNGVLDFAAGSLSASWDGVEFRLGFAPQMIDGHVFLHALDIQKNLAPLLLNHSLPAMTNRVIVIDPGHGGFNTGTRSFGDPRNEKVFTLDWALRTAELLATNGWQVFLTRTNDVDVSLTDRVNFAEEHNADLFVSLHFNSSGGGGREQAGLETYCLTPAGMTSTLTRGYNDDPDQSFPNNEFDEQNFLLAMRLHRAVLETAGSTDRGVRRARFLTVLRGQNRPAVLIEGGYLSNPAEARRIADPAFRQTLAEAVAKGLE